MNLRGNLFLYLTYTRFSSMANGSPSAIQDKDTDTVLPSGSKFYPGDFIPLGYSAASIKLAQINGHIFQGLYSVPSQRVLSPSGNRLTRKIILDLYGELTGWQRDVPTHLRIKSNVADNPLDPAVLRALTFLDLRFQFAVISVTRPLLFRLVSVIRDGSFDTMSAGSRDFLTTYSKACAQSARSSLRTLKFMRRNQLLNDCLWLDVFYILSTAMVLLLEYIRAPSSAEAYRLNECISMLRELQPRGTARNVLDSLSDLVAFLGLDDLPVESSTLDPLHNGGGGELQLYELFNITTSSSGIMEGSIQSPDIGIIGMGKSYGIRAGEGANNFAWMDQIIRIAAELGPA